MANHSPAADQLVNYAKTVRGTPETITTKSGNPVGVKSAILTVGERGPLLLQDVHFLDEISSFARERIPERVVHAKGAGAFGYFEVTHDITKYCAAKLFDTIGKKTPVGIRFSTVAGEVGSPDTVRDPRGFAVRFYTEEGNWDIVGNNTPIFFIKDAALFPSFIHMLKRNPETHLKDANMFWDFITLRHECVHQTLFTYSDRGIPDGYRYMNGYGSHTFKMVNEQGVSHYVKFHFKTNQGIRNIPAPKAEQLCATEPDYSISDLYDAIAKGEYPSWTLYIQAMTMREAETESFDPFDMTKVWPHSQYPLIPIGKLTLNRNPKNYFAEVEQLGFNPANLVPGIEPSPDKMLQGRLIAYGDTQRHRLGANYLQIPVNCPYGVHIRNYQRDGPQNITDNQGGAPNYFPNSFSGPIESHRAKVLQPKWTISGDVIRHDSGDSQDNYSQAAVFYTKVLTEDERARLAENLVDHLKITVDFIQERAIKMFTRTHPDLGKKVASGLARHKKFYQANL